MAYKSFWFSLLAVGAISCGSSDWSAALPPAPETEPKPSVMGVSIAGDFENATSRPSGAHQLAPQSGSMTAPTAQHQSRKSLPAKVFVQTKGQVQERSKPNPKRIDAIEATLDSWQKNAKGLWNWTSPRFTSFCSWAAQKLRLGKAGTIPNLKIANCQQPKHTKVDLQPISGQHPTWVLPDGRMKTVAAR